MQLPFRFGRYELQEYLGGGMSRVYRAHDTLMNRPSVVKILVANDTESKARFLHEARVAGSIQHENIVRVFDVGEVEGHPYMVMEYLTGVDLRTAIQEGRWRSGLSEQIKIAIQIAEAIQYIHRLEIVHRDIKPANIHVDAWNRIKLMDFGVAKTTDFSLTTPGMVVGTPYYMAPEVAKGQPATKLADIYSFGVLLFELLTGLRGVNAETIEGILYQVVNTPLDETALMAAGVPPAIRSVVMRATAKDPNSRPQDFGIIVDTLKSYWAQPEALLSPPSVKEASRAGPQRYYLVFFAAAVLIVALSVAGWLWLRSLPNPHPIPSPREVGSQIPGTLSSAPPEIPGMIYVSGGIFLSGKDKHPASVQAFYIDEAEVSVGAFCTAMSCPTPPKSPDLPKVYVTVQDAREYAKRVGKRLPTALEWERAARGRNGNTYPWGDADDPALANVKNNPSARRGAHVLPVRSFKPYPEYQMIGNVWEMVEGSVTPGRDDLESRAFKGLKPTAQEPWISILGGSAGQPLSPGLVWITGHIPERYYADSIGFRCAKDP